MVVLRFCAGPLIHKLSPLGLLATCSALASIGYLQESSATQQLATDNPALYQTVTVEKHYLIGAYRAIDPEKVSAVTDNSARTQILSATTTGQFNALAKTALFPLSLFACYVALILYFKSRGGNKPVRLTVAKKK